MGDFHGFGSATSCTLNTKAAKTSAMLCLIFLVVYGTINWLTAFRHGVGTCYFERERHIPFVPVMIVPYMSIDLFFIAPLPLRSTCHQVYHRRRDHVLRRAWRAQMAPM